MNDYKFLSKTIIAQLNTGNPAVLISIISMEGSTPRESGTKMVVTAGGNYGTIGGSLLEAAAIKKARRILTTGQSELMDFDLSGESTSSPGMICGGKAQLLLDFLVLSKENQSLFKDMYARILEGRKFYYITCFTNPNSDLEIAGRCLLFPDGSTVGDRTILPPDISPIQEQIHHATSTTVLPVGNAKIIIDPVSRFKTLYCFGAGHVAVPTVHLAAMVGFQVVVIDDREEFANTQRFPDAGRVIVISDFSRALSGLEIDEDSFIVIITRGHMYDRIVLEQALKTRAGYIGMISSKTKRDAIYSTLLTEGIATPKDLERVYSPIGLPIGGDTPEEIAVSIAAELISVREKQKI
jgi:xanthine dehydrogenase accessory factor